MSLVGRYRAGGPARAGHNGAGNATASSDFVRSLARGLDVIKAFRAENPQMTLSEVARATGLDAGGGPALPA